MDSGNDFGNYRQATKSGMKFEDLDADGVKDAGEPGLGGWTINAFADANSNGILDPSETTIAASAVTNGSGAYSMNLAPGRYVVCEVLQATWTQSFPSGTACGAGAGGYGIALASGQIDDGNDFGNWRAATKTGVKFEDLNANGARDGGEPGLPRLDDQRVRRHERRRHPQHRREHDRRHVHDQRERHVHDESHARQVRGVRGAAGDVDAVVPRGRRVRHRCGRLRRSRSSRASWTAATTSATTGWPRRPARSSTT